MTFSVQSPSSRPLLDFAGSSFPGQATGSRAIIARRSSSSSAGAPGRALSLLHFSKCSRLFILSVTSTPSHLKSWKPLSGAHRQAPLEKISKRFCYSVLDLLDIQSISNCCIHIYIYAVELKTGPIFAFSSVKNWSNFFCFVFFCFLKNIILPAERRGFFKKNKKWPISSVKNWSNFVAQHNWTSF